jgi:hypothetical protein
VPFLRPDEEGTEGCVTTPTSIKAGIQTFMPTDLRRGDAEFNGNGPCIKLQIDLTLRDGATRLVAKIQMTAWECNADDLPTGDGTTVNGSTEIELFRAGSGERIVGFNAQPSLPHEYHDSNTADDPFSFGGNSPVEQLIFTGDTNGSEAGTRTKVVIYFRPFEVDVERCSEP